MKSKTKKVLLRNLKGYAFAAPNFILMLVFMAFPVCFALILSVTQWDLVSGIGNIKFVGLKNFMDMLQDKWFLNSLFNNFYFTLTVVPGTMITALLVAVIINDFVPGKGFFRMIMYIPSMSSIVAVSLVWSLLYSKYGPIVNFLKSIGISNTPAFLADRFWAMPSIIIMSIWLQLGYVALIYGAGLQGIPNELYEAAHIDGAGWWRKFFSVTIPMLSPTTFFILITLVISSFKVFGQVQLMTDGGPMGASTVLVYYIYQSAFRFYKFGYASAMALVLFLIIMLFTFVQWRGQKKWVNY